MPAGNRGFLYKRHLKSASPQVTVQDNEMIPGIFPGKVIIVAEARYIELIYSGKKAKDRRVIIK
jgi:hypothetical protein